MSFSGKVVLVIGASSGIGAATAILFSKEGAEVVMVGRNEAKLNDVAAHCKKYKTPFIIRADISKDAEAVAIVTKTIEKYQRLDVLVNNAGIVRYGSILDGNLLRSFDEVINTNLRALVHLTALAAPHLVKTKGNIVNISSVTGSIVLKNETFNAYCMSKAGLNHFTRYAAMELASHGVRVNSISPGPVMTGILESSGSNVISVEDFRKATALNRVSDAEEIANLILFLSSDKARSVTGSDYVIDNGFSLVQ